MEIEIRVIICDFVSEFFYIWYKEIVLRRRIGLGWAWSVYQVELPPVVCGKFTYKVLDSVSSTLKHSPSVCCVGIHDWW